MYSSKNGSYREHWAYVTFYSDKDACFALLNELNYKEEMKWVKYISPASTWRQPVIVERASSVDENLSAASNRSSLLELNDHCLLKIVSYCDLHTKANLWQVCTKIRSLLNEFVLPKEKQDYEIVWDFCEEPPLQSLKRVRDELKYIGPRVKKLRLAVDVDNENDYYYYEEPPALDRFLQKCGRYAYTSIKELELVRMPDGILCGRNLKLIRPILDNIEILTIENDKNWKKSVNIQLPNLKHLLIMPDPLGGNGGMDLHFIQQNLANLEKLTLRHVADSYKDDVKKKLSKCLKNNLKLEYLEMHANNFNDISESTITSMKNLEELVIFDITDGIDNVNCFNKLDKLRKLGMSFLYWAEKSSLMYTIDIACKNKNLKSVLLKVDVDPYQKKYIDHEDNFYIALKLARELPCLEHFYIDVDMTESVIKQIVEIARNLKTLWVGSSAEGTELTYDLMKTLAVMRKSHFENNAAEITVLDFISYINRSAEKIRQLVCSHFKYDPQN